MLTKGTTLSLCCLMSIAGSASAQFFATGFDTSVYGIAPDVAQATATASSLSSAGLTPGGTAYDGTYLYVENFANPGEIARIDPTGATATTYLARQYATASGGANDNLGADGSGVLWEIDNGTNNLYSLTIDGAGNVTRTFEGAIAAGGSAPITIGDLAWGPDGLLYISSMEGNFTWDPSSGTSSLLSGPEFFIGLAWFDGQLYGSIGDGFVRGLLPLDASMQSGLSYIFQFGASGFTDLASFNGSGPEEPCDPTQPTVNVEGGVQVQTLWAGQHIDAGTVTVEVVGDDLVVTYNTANGWSLDEVHLWVGDDRADMPQNRKGSPKIGHFPYTGENMGGLTTYSVSIPLDGLGISCPVDPDRDLYVAAHAVVSSAGGGSETAWADGDRFAPRGMWGMRFSSSFDCVCDGPPPVVRTCETAYATDDGAICFLDIDANGDNIIDANDFSTWGWTIFIPHTEVDGFYSFPIYARAEDCDTATGIIVGVLNVTYEVPDDVTTTPVQVRATYVMNPGYEMDEIYFYQGGTPLPIDLVANEPTVALEWFTVAVDNFMGSPDENVATEHLVDFVWDPILAFDANGNPQFQGVYIIANASVCGNFPAQP